MSTLPNVRIGHAEALVRAPARPAEITNKCALCVDGTTRTLFQVDGTLIVVREQLELRWQGCWLGHAMPSRR